MGAFSIWHWLVVLAVVLLMFGGRGKISALMGDFGKGLTSFKKGMKEGDTAEADTDEAKALRADDASPDTAKSDQAAKT
jgi:sec-independent protein translocase protein TatA